MRRPTYTPEEFEAVANDAALFFRDCAGAYMRLGKQCSHAPAIIVGIRRFVVQFIAGHCEHEMEDHDQTQERTIALGAEFLSALADELGGALAQVAKGSGEPTHAVSLTDILELAERLSSQGGRQ